MGHGCLSLFIQVYFGFIPNKFPFAPAFVSELGRKPVISHYPISYTHQAPSQVFRRQSRPKFGWRRCGISMLRRQHSSTWVSTELLIWAPKIISCEWGWRHFLLVYSTKWYHSKLLEWTTNHRFHNEKPTRPNNSPYGPTKQIQSWKFSQALCNATVAQVPMGSTFHMLISSPFLRRLDWRWNTFLHRACSYSKLQTLVLRVPSGFQLSPP